MSEMILKPLTRNQIRSISGGKHWSEKKEFIIKRVRSYGIQITEDHLYYFMEVYVPSEQKRINRNHWANQMSGKKKTRYTPTDIKEGFDKVAKPQIGKYYHVSWAFSGAIFVLKRIEHPYGYLDNPKNKRKELLRVRLEDLRHTRRHSINNNGN